MDSEELLALISASLALAAGLASRVRRVTRPTRQLLRRMMGCGALLGAVALALSD